MFGGNSGLGSLAWYEFGRWSAENERARQEWVAALRERHEIREIDALAAENRNLVDMFNSAQAELAKGNVWFQETRDYIKRHSAHFCAEIARLEIVAANLRAKIAEWTNHADCLQEQLAASQKEVADLTRQLQGSRETSRRRDVAEYHYSTLLDFAVRGKNITQKAEYEELERIFQDIRWAEYVEDEQAARRIEELRAILKS
jgi:hypothetical protein